MRCRGLFTQPAGRRGVPFRFAAAGLRIRPAALPSRPSACKGAGGGAGAAGESEEELIDRAEALNSERAVLVAPGLGLQAGVGAGGVD